jgi:hypothetical protein
MATSSSGQSDRTPLTHSRASRAALGRGPRCNGFGSPTAGGKRLTIPMWSDGTQRARMAFQWSRKSHFASSGFRARESQGMADLHSRFRG